MGLELPFHNLHIYYMSSSLYWIWIQILCVSMCRYELCLSICRYEFKSYKFKLLKKLIIKKLHLQLTFIGKFWVNPLFNSFATYSNHWIKGQARTNSHMRVMYILGNILYLLYSFFFSYMQVGLDGVRIEYVLKKCFSTSKIKNAFRRNFRKYF